MFEENYEKVEDAVQAVKATIDDVDSVTVFLATTLADNDGEPVPEVGMVLHYCNGRQGFVSRTLAASLLNDGVCGRLRIPLKFI